MDEWMSLLNDKQKAEIKQLMDRLKASGNASQKIRDAIRLMINARLRQWGIQIPPDTKVTPPIKVTPPVQQRKPADRRRKRIKHLRTRRRKEREDRREDAFLVKRGMQRGLVDDQRQRAVLPRRQRAV